VIVNQVNKSNSELKGMNESKSNKKGSKWDNVNNK
jgi:hypothetical protein